MMMMTLPHKLSNFLTTKDAQNFPESVLGQHPVSANQ
jgi:hypothetical protein